MGACNSGNKKTRDEFDENEFTYEIREYSSIAEIYRFTNMIFF